MAERKAIPTSQVKPKKSAEIVAGRLRLAIVNGDIPRGEMLPVERDLIESFGVSRATMREALPYSGDGRAIRSRTWRQGWCAHSRPNASAGLACRGNGAAGSGYTTG